MCILVWVSAMGLSGCLTEIQVGNEGSGDGKSTEGQDCDDGSCVETCDPECDPVLETCSRGACACRLGLVACGGTCVDPNSAPDHCGRCGEVCGDLSCQNGECSSDPCDTEERTDCDGACVDTDEHPLHCGGCGLACMSDEVCSNGNCVRTTGATCLGDEQCEKGSRCCEAGFFDGRVCIEASECP